MSDPQQPPYGDVPAVPPAPAAYPPAPPAPQAPPAYSAPPPYAAPSAYPTAPTQAPVPPDVPPAPAPVGAPQFPAPGAPAFAQPAPPGAYQVPVGGYAAPSGAYQVPRPTERKSALLGILALIFAAVSAVVTPIVVGVAGYEIGRRIPGGLDTTDPDLLSVLSPARDQVLWAEISFWTGTILGIAAIVIGIIAIRRNQGRGAGIAALVVAVIGPIIFWVVLLFAISAGTAAGFLPTT